MDPALFWPHAQQVAKSLLSYYIPSYIVMMAQFIFKKQCPIVFELLRRRRSTNFLVSHTFPFAPQIILFCPKSSFLSTSSISIFRFWGLESCWETGEALFSAAGFLPVVCHFRHQFCRFFCWQLSDKNLNALKTFRYKTFPCRLAAGDLNLFISLLIRKKLKIWKLKDFYCHQSFGPIFPTNFMDPNFLDPNFLDLNFLDLNSLDLNFLDPNFWDQFFGA